MTAQKHHRIQAQIVQRTLTLATTEMTRYTRKLVKKDRVARKTDFAKS
jgi:hypothetical protein